MDIKAAYIDKLATSGKAITTSKPVFGIAVNDARTTISRKVNGVMLTHRAYTAWKEMIRRCYEPHMINRNPSYIECTVCDDWLNFSNFLQWWKVNHVDGWQLDKDLLVNGNTVYSPDTCLFVPAQINAFLYNPKRAKSKTKLGVSFDSRSLINPYSARIWKGGKQVVLGRFPTENEAHIAWAVEKLLILISAKDELNLIHPSLFDCMNKKLKSLYDFN